MCFKKKTCCFAPKKPKSEKTSKKSDNSKKYEVTEPVKTVVNSEAPDNEIVKVKTTMTIQKEDEVKSHAPKIETLKSIELIQDNTEDEMIQQTMTYPVTIEQ